MHFLCISSKVPGLLLVSSLTSFRGFISDGIPEDGGGVKLEGCEGGPGVGCGGATLGLDGGGAAGVDDELPIL